MNKMWQGRVVDWLSRRAHHAKRWKAIAGALSSKMRAPLPHAASARRRSAHGLLIAISLTIASLMASPGHAATIIWAGVAGNWSTGSNWIGGVAPGSSDTASFQGFASTSISSVLVVPGTESPNTKDRAIDGNRATFWWSGGFQANGQCIVLDLGSVKTFASIVIDAGSTYDDDYGGGFNIYGSGSSTTCGASWSSVIASKAGSEITSISFSPATYRYIKVALTSARTTKWWAVGEFKVFATGGSSVTATISASTTVAALDMTSAITVAQAAGQTLTVTGTATIGSGTTYTGSSGTLAVGTSLTLSGGTFTASSGNISVADLLVSGGTFAAGSGTVTVTDDFNFSGGTFTGSSGTVRVVDDFNMSHSSGTFTAPSGRLEVAGAFTKTNAGTFAHNNGQVMLNSVDSEVFTTNGASFYDVTINDGLVAYWPFEETVSPSYDQSGYDRDIVWAGSTNDNAENATTNFTNTTSLGFDGVDDYGSFTSPDMTATTISVWVYSENRSFDFPRILEMPAFQLSFTDSTQTPVPPQVPNAVAWTVVTDGSANYSWRTIAGSISDDSWIHIACTFNGSSAATVYINGVLQALTATTTPDGSPESNVGTGYIGNNGTGVSRDWNGFIDDLRIYDRVLSAAEISSLAIGNQPWTTVTAAIQTMSGTPSVANNLTLASGTLAAGAINFSVGGSWNNYGGIFTGTGTITLNSTGAETIRSAGRPFTNLILSGSGATWTLQDWLKVDSALTMTAGALSPGAYAVHAGSMPATSGTFTAGTGTVVMDTTTNGGVVPGFAFNNLRVETPDENNLLGYWRFEEGRGPTTADASGNGNNGTLAGNTRWTSASLPATAHDNHAAGNFNGTSDYVSLGNPASLNFTGQITLAAWVSPTATDGYRSIIAHGWDDVGGGNEVVLRINGNFYQVAMWDNPTVLLVSSAVPAGDLVANTWTHVAGVYDGTTWRLYRNGTEVGTPAVGTGAPLVGHNWVIGSNRDGSQRYFKGFIDDVRVYNVGLTAAQVGNLAAGRYSGRGSPTTVTMAANSSVSGVLSIDSGTLATDAYTMNASAAGNVVAVNSSGTYQVGSAMQTMAGGLTVQNGGTLSLPASGGTVAIGSGKTLTMNGTLSASSTGAIIQGVASGKYNFKVGSVANATPTLNISGLQVKDTTANGMYINSEADVSTSVTTFTRFDNIAFSSGFGAGAGATNYNLRIFATGLNLTSTGCTFDSGVNKSVERNVKLAGNGGATVTRAVFGGATCALNGGGCENYDLDDDNSSTIPALTFDGVGENSGDLAVIQWVTSASTDTSGSIEGFPTAAINWSNFTYYSTYVAYHDTAGTTADTVYVRSATGAAKYSWSTPLGEEIIGTPRWDTVGGIHYVYVATTSGKVYRLIDTTTGTSPPPNLTPDTVSPWNGVNPPPGQLGNPFNCNCTITTPLAQNTTHLFWGGIQAVVDGGPSSHKLWTLSKTSTTRMPPNSPLSTGVGTTTQNAAPAIWTSGSTFAFLGMAGSVSKIDTTNQVTVYNNINPGGSVPVTGRITIVNNKLYAGDNKGYMWCLDPGTNFDTLSGLHKNWEYHHVGHVPACGGTECQIKSSYFSFSNSRLYYGDQDGHVYVLNSSGARAETWFPYIPGTSADAFATAPLFVGNVILIGTTTGTLYIIDQNYNGASARNIQTYQFGSSTKVSGIAYDNSTSNYMISTASDMTKDGKVYYIPVVTDPTPSFK